MRRFLLPPMRPDGSILRTWRAEPPPPEWRYDPKTNPHGLLEVQGKVLSQARYASGETQRHYAEYLCEGHAEYSQGDVSMLEHHPEHSWVNVTLARKLAEVYELALDQVVCLPAGVHVASNP